MNTASHDMARSLVVLRGSVPRAAFWVAGGTVGAHVVDLGSFVAAVPETVGRAPAPYDDGALMLVSRPTPMPMRPSLGVHIRENRVMFCVQQRQWRSKPHWFVIEQGVGPVRSTLLQATKADLLTTGHVPHAEALNRVLAQADAPVLDIARGVLAALGLPGGEILGAAITPDTRFVTPKRRALRRFEKNIDDDRADGAVQEEWS